MIATVSTVKDSLAGVQRFVRGNLAGGVDHMVVLLDAPDPDVEAWLAAQDNVTHVVTDEAWWGDERPADLNDRQRIGANLVKALFTVVPGVDWVFHVDGDEICQIDRSVMDRVPADQEAVRLKPLEAVSRKHWEASPTWFKRLLRKADLELLEVLGVIEKANNGQYFHGHVEGKTATRPRLDRWLTIHRTVDEKRDEVPHFEAAGLRVLHYESYSGEDFVRKWSAMLAAGPNVSLRPVRERTKQAVAALAFGAIGRTDAQPILRTLMKDKDKRVRVVFSWTIDLLAPPTLVQLKVGSSLSQGVEQLHHLARVVPAGGDDAGTDLDEGEKLPVADALAQLEAQLITAVTVRPTHRRRGLLRRLITSDLEQAARSGLGIAALTASEATIYGRFGFGAATFTRGVEVDVQERFGLRTPPAGTVEMADPASLQQLGPEIFARFHARTPGSVARQYSYAKRISGRWGHDKPEPDRSIRAAVHYDSSGMPQGYVSYRFAGWSKEPYTMKVVDLVAATGESYRELWRYLGSIDLVQRISWSLAPVEDPLPWALQDGRGYAAKSAEDVLWLRILDPVHAFQARHYDGEGRLALEIVDPLGLAAGRFLLEAAGGKARVHPLAPDDAVDLSVDVDVLGSLYLGGVRAGTLAAAGRLPGATEDAIGKLERIFTTKAQPYCITHF